MMTVAIVHSCAINQDKTMSLMLSLFVVIWTTFDQKDHIALDHLVMDIIFVVNFSL